jgi:hypothetical protein
MTIPITTWSYNGQHSGIRHMGPVAQDFYASFGIGEDDRHITTIDADGVAFASIQGLYAIVQSQAAELEAQRVLNADQEAELETQRAINAEYEARIAALEGLASGSNGNTFGAAAGILLPALIVYALLRRRGEQSSKRT